MMAMAPPSIEEKVAFLRRADSYPNGARRVEVKETHMSWIFLTETYAWKLKKPVRNDYLDFSTPEARRVDCEREITLNRRLAPTVYVNVVPLTYDAGLLEVAGRGTPVDWLVQMRRLPDERMLDRAIADRTWSGEDLRRVGTLLGRFYRTAPAAEENGPEYLRRLAQDLRLTRFELQRPEYGLPLELVDAVTVGALNFIEQRPDLLDDRVGAGRIVDAHGDLRPEHICLELQPAIIDCLEFNRSLRILDFASELSFLNLECERLGAPEVAGQILEACRTETGDQPLPQLLQFYRSYHACVRAKLAVWHLRDTGKDDAPKWTDRATTYLRLAAR